jgi:propionate catabolism operon transcriptional regulator
VEGRGSKCLAKQLIGVNCGAVRASDQGTRFLDEIGDLALHAQPAPLRVLQEREVLAIGAARATPVDPRASAAGRLR